MQAQRASSDEMALVASDAVSIRRLEGAFYRMVRTPGFHFVRSAGTRVLETWLRAFAQRNAIDLVRMEGTLGALSVEDDRVYLVHYPRGLGASDGLWHAIERSRRLPCIVVSPDHAETYPWMVYTEMPLAQEVASELPRIWEVMVDQRAGRKLSSTERALVRQLGSLMAELAMDVTLDDIDRMMTLWAASSFSGSLADVARELITLRFGEWHPVQDRDQSLGQRILEAAANRTSLATALQGESPVVTHTVFEVLRAYLGRELRVLARMRGQDLDSVADVSRRTILNWWKSSGEVSSENED